jgi:UDP-N-acetyl-D-glucosamine dehydrogenase
MSEYIVKRVESENTGGLSGKNVLVVGVAYKPNVADTRETAAELVIERLRAKGANVTWHDDLVSEWKSEFSSPLEGADITVVVTKHDVDSHARILNSAPYVFDTTGTISGAHSL